jgi:enolase-phosphatase E1
MARYILTDIEGTTTDIAFVHKVLFPYSARALPAFVATHAHNEMVGACLEDTRAALRQQRLPHERLEDLVAGLLSWIADDVKQPSLKTLQGLIWREGYLNGAFQGHVYPDVAPQLRAWRRQGLRLGVYSSGSVEAQRLLFAHSMEGDLTPLFSHYFDTGVGHKKEPESYREICLQLDMPASSILFLSDVEAELDAACEAGMLAIQLARGDISPSVRHPVARDFFQIDPLGL